MTIIENQHKPFPSRLEQRSEVQPGKHDDSRQLLRRQHWKGCRFVESYGCCGMGQVQEKRSRIVVGAIDSKPRAGSSAVVCIGGCENGLAGTGRAADPDQLCGRSFNAMKEPRSEDGVLYQRTRDLGGGDQRARWEH